MANRRTVEHQGFVSRSPDQTRAFGTLLGEAAMPGELVLLHGSFGAGKTTLVQGIASGLGVQGRVTSPSFTLINEYQGRIPLYHVDLYRLNELDPEMEQAIESCEESGGMTVVEWPKLLRPDLEEGALRIDMAILDDDDRSLVADVEGSRWDAGELVRMMEKALGSRMGSPVARRRESEKARR